MRRFFASEPRLSREELERQAQDAIDARISLGRPPEEEFEPIRKRLAEIDLALAARPSIDSEPLEIREVRVPPAAPAASEPAAKPVRRQLVTTAKQSSN